MKKIGNTKKPHHNNQIELKKMWQNVFSKRFKVILIISNNFRPRSNTKRFCALFQLKLFHLLIQKSP